jgi:hypothetical protein
MRGIFLSIVLGIVKMDDEAWSQYMSPITKQQEIFPCLPYARRFCVARKKGWVESEVEIGSGEKSSPLAGHPARLSAVIGLQLPVSSGQQEKKSTSRIFLLLSSKKCKD